MDFHKINLPTCWMVIAPKCGWNIGKTHLRYYLGLQVGFLIALLLFIYNVVQAFTNGYDEESTYEALGIMAHSMASIGCITLYAAFIFSASAVFFAKNRTQQKDRSTDDSSHNGRKSAFAFYSL